MTKAKYSHSSEERIRKLLEDIAFEVVFENFSVKNK